jgi:FdrA protein
MKITGFVKKGEYYDSISIMLIAKQLEAIDLVIDSAVVMGTDENKSVLTSSGLSVKEFEQAGEMDLIISFKTENDSDAEKVILKLNELLTAKKKESSDSTINPSGIEEALKVVPGANLALISVAGRYAGDVAMKSLEKGLNVMLFSDNVSIEKEIELKKYAKEKNLLVMGPDCGTAIINGVPLAFANVVNRGDIGIVGASGTGLQEVSCIISNSGCGVSQAIGTGGRDVKKDVGGIMFLEALKALAEDESTKVILLISKPPAKEVIGKIVSAVNGIKKPIVSVFLGASPELLKGSGINSAPTLEMGAKLAAAFSKGENIAEINDSILKRESEIMKTAAAEAAKLSAGQKYLRGLFSGGTFCDEAQLLAAGKLKDIYSNTPVANVAKLINTLQSEKHTIIDLGDDEFTVGKPHPMIDFSTRNKKFVSEAEDPETAVILFDLVLGYGSNMTPLADIIPALKEVKETAAGQKRYLPVICSVIGTDLDPQNRSAVISALKAEGIIVMESNAAASKLAVSIASCRE